MGSRPTIRSHLSAVASRCRLESPTLAVSTLSPFEDPLAAMATTDEARLRELLAEVSVDSDAPAVMLTGLAPAGPKDGR